MSINLKFPSLLKAVKFAECPCTNCINSSIKLADTFLGDMVTSIGIGEHWCEISFFAESCLPIVLVVNLMVIGEHYLEFPSLQKAACQSSWYKLKCQIGQHFPWRYGQLNGYWWTLIWNFLFCRKLLDDHPCTNWSVKLANTFFWMLWIFIQQSHALRLKT